MPRQKEFYPTETAVKELTARINSLIREGAIFKTAFDLSIAMGRSTFQNHTVKYLIENGYLIEKQDLYKVNPTSGNYWKKQYHFIKNDKPIYYKTLQQYINEFLRNKYQKKEKKQMKLFRK